MRIDNTGPHLPSTSHRTYTTRTSLRTHYTLMHAPWLPPWLPPPRTHNHTACQIRLIYKSLIKSIFRGSMRDLLNIRGARVRASQKQTLAGRVFRAEYIRVFLSIRGLKIAVSHWGKFPLCCPNGLNDGNSDARHGDAFYLSNASHSRTFVHTEKTVAGKSLNSPAVTVSRSGSKTCPRSL